MSRGITLRAGARAASRIAGAGVGNGTSTTAGGFTVSTKDMKVSGVLWDSPAFDAGLTVGTQIMAVNGRAFDPDALKAAVKAG